MLFFGCQKITNTAVPSPTQEQSMEDFEKAKQSTLGLLASEKLLPPNEKILALEDLYDKFLVVTNSKQYIDNNGGYTWAPAKIWIVSADGKETKLLLQAETEQSENVNLKWVSGSDRIMDVQFQEGTADYMLLETQTFDYYIDVEDKNVLAASSWTTESPEFTLEIAKQKYKISLLAKHGCKTQYTDSGIGLLINNLEAKFTKGHSISCAVTYADGGGEAYPSMPEIGAPFFHDNRIVSFNLPWGTPVDIDLEKLSMHSKDLDHDYALQTDTAR